MTATPACAASVAAALGGAASEVTHETCVQVLIETVHPPPPSCPPLTPPPGPYRDHEHD